jgi:hypothetical protein
VIPNVKRTLMTERNLFDDGGTDDHLDPDRSHALLAQLISDVPAADELTRARHLRTALDAFDAPPVRKAPRWLTAVAAATIGLVGFGAVLPLLLANGQDDADMSAVESGAATLSATEGEADEIPSQMRATVAPEEAAISEAAAVDRLFNLTGLCDLEIESLTYEEASQGSGGSTWVAYDGSEDSRAVILVDSSDEITSLEEAQAVSDSNVVPRVRLLLDPSTCSLLRTERAAP